MLMALAVTPRPGGLLSDRQRADAAEVDERVERDLDRAGGFRRDCLQGQGTGAVEPGNVGHGGGDLADRRLGSQYVGIGCGGEIELGRERAHEGEHVDVGRHQRVVVHDAE